MRSSLVLLPLALGVALLAGISCHDDSGDYAGQPCDVPDECYPEVDPGALRGNPICLDRVEGGYCTHLCQTDADCCAVEGECRTDFPQVCAPFESTGMMMCFLSCEASDIDGYDPGSFCQEEVHPAFGCRSTGGGSNNRKVCLP
ncbi:hypothetical protein [Paraliomyxa miuraensis]|uniref:hypothetical protein n=1 Tax=Paraliomyxa miuraensis TaxID=376150 RepID=UPI0022511CD1|nr:hypothetical protein [Paraliomyxa miuraensis]MCX4247153.1 hypothetical protein [Paraliomyxa miuraensis]